MGEDTKPSPGQWPPWINDPDLPAPPMTEEQITAFANVAKLMAERREQLGQEFLYTVLRNNPSL